MDYTVLMWVPISLYTVASWPQILTNYRRGDAVGLSAWMLFLRIFAVSTYTVYVYLLNLPLAHKVLYPACLSGIIVLALQGYFYDKIWHEQRWLRFCYLKLVSTLVALLIFSQWYPLQAGMLGGWLAVITGVMSDMPQIYRNWKRKSTVGFNILFSSAIGWGGICDLSLSLYYGLPMPTILATLRVTTCYLIYLAQFFIYRNRSSATASGNSGAK
ncbi:MAG: hypothetical protein QG604_774 [Candidatus Dependentiae bacterium]|nr:hypothetical protein [Candidatus Dependentiae bacterium]